jgi:hypothetical protein
MHTITCVFRNLQIKDSKYIDKIIIDVFVNFDQVWLIEINIDSTCASYYSKNLWLPVITIQGLKLSHKSYNYFNFIYLTMQIFQNRTKLLKEYQPREFV